MLSDASNGNSYVEARRERVQENIKRFEGLGISTISRSLLEVANCEPKLMKCQRSPKSKKALDISEIRRSSRARNPVPSYRDEVDNIDLRSSRRRYSKRSYGEVRTASYEEQLHAIKRAEKLQSDLKPEHPSFVKPMVRSHVSSCFWLLVPFIFRTGTANYRRQRVLMLLCSCFHKGLPRRFCKDHLPSHELKMVLEDEDGLEYDTIYIGSRTGLSGGWRGFSLDHNLDDGDALVFELCQPARFKVYIVKASEQSSQYKSDVELNNAAAAEAEVGTATKSTGTTTTKAIESDNASDSKKAPTRKQPKRLVRTESSLLQAADKY